MKHLKEITIRHNDHMAPIQTVHPLDTIRAYMFIKKIAGEHDNYWKIANSQAGNIILVIPRNAFRRRGRYYVQRPNQS